MTKLDLATYPAFHPAAAHALGSLDFIRPRLLQLIEPLTPEQLVAKPEGHNNSIATLCLHLAAAEVMFSHAIMAKRMTEELQNEYLLNMRSQTLPESSGETAASLTAKLEKSRSYVVEALSQVTEESLDREFPLGPERSATVRWALGLLPLHQAQHFGHMQLLKRQV